VLGIVESFSTSLGLELIDESLAVFWWVFLGVLMNIFEGL
jgi:hypothetical protein